MQEFKTKKLYGYMTCITLMLVMISTHPTQTEASKSEKTYITESALKTDIKDLEKTGVQSKRIYFIDNQPITVDTSKQGWAVDLLLSDQ